MGQSGRVTGGGQYGSRPSHLSVKHFDLSYPIHKLSTVISSRQESVLDEESGRVAAIVSIYKHWTTNVEMPSSNQVVKFGGKIWGPVLPSGPNCPSIHRFISERLNFI